MSARPEISRKGPTTIPLDNGLFAGRYRLGPLLKDHAGVRTHLADDIASLDRVVIRLRTSQDFGGNARILIAHHTTALGGTGAESAPRDHGDHADNHYVARPYIEGAPLNEAIERGRLKLRDAVQLGIDIAGQLAAAHGANVTHGALSPSNIILHNDRAVLVDFGCARATGAQDGSRRITYLAPEQIGSVDAPIDERSDLYALGAILYHALVAQPPFTETSVHALIRQQLAERPAPLRNHDGTIPRAVDELVQRLLAKDPRERYQTAKALFDDLTLILHALESSGGATDIVLGSSDQRETLTDSAFVPRPRETTLLHAAAQRAREGTGGIVLLEAESGGGKSRLLDEFAQEARARGHRIYRGQGADQVAQHPFQILAGVLEGAARVISATPEDRPTFRDAMSDDLEALAHLSPHLREALGVEGGTEEVGPEAHGERRSIQCLSKFLDALGTPQSPAIIVLDDAQWADDASIKLLQQWSEVVSRARHVVIVAAFRTEEVSADHPLRRPTPLKTIALDPFSWENTNHLVESMAGPVPQEATDLVHELSNGSPFMATAVVRGLVEGGALVRTQDGWTIDPRLLAEMRSSDRSGAFLVKRLRLLPETTLRALGIGAVFGKTFELEAVSDLSSDSGPATLTALEEARKRHIVWGLREQGKYAFVHDKLREALLEMLNEDERSRLHRAAAEQIESTIKQSAFDIAYHYDAAQDPQRALPYALEAAETARRHHALGLAEDNYRIARRGVTGGDTPTRKRIEEGLGEVLMLRGRYDEAATCLETARQFAATPREQAEVLAKSGELAFKRGDVRGASEALEEGLKALGRRTPRTSVGYLTRVAAEALVQFFHTLFPRVFLARKKREGADEKFLEMRLLSRLAYAYWFHKGLVACGWAHLREMNLAECYGESEELAQAYSEHAPVMTMLPYASRGIEYADRSQAIRERAGNIWGQGQSRHFRAVVLYSSSRYEECITESRKAIRLLSKTGDMWEVNTAHWHVAFSQHRLGLRADAIRTAKAVHTSARDIGDVQAMGISLGVWARASNGDIPPKLLADALARGTDDAHASAEVAMASALHSLYNNDARAAVETLRAAQAMIEKRGLRQEYVAPLLPWLATALHARTRMTGHTLPEYRALIREGTRVSKRAVRLARAYKNNLPHALRERARFRELAGRPERARLDLEESLRVATKQHATYEAHLTQTALSELATAHGWSIDGLGPTRPITEDPIANTDTLSLQDRYRNLIEAGRAIATMLEADAILDTTTASANTLLRAPRTRLLALQPGSPELPPGERALFDRALRSGDVAIYRADKPETTDDALLAGNARSGILAIIRVRGTPHSALYAEHDSLTGAFGDEERNITLFLAAIAGGALENAAGFAEIRQVNERLHVQKNLLERQGEVSMDGILVVDSEGKILSANRRFAEMWHLAAADLADDDKALSAVTHMLTDPAEFLGRVRHLYGHPEEEARDEVQLVDGRVIDRYTAPIRAADGNVSARVWFFRDVTEMKKAESNLQDMNRRLKEIGSLKTLLLNTASHELNTPLTPLKVQVHMLESGKLGELTARQQKAVAVMTRNLNRLGSLVKDLMDVSRIQGGRLRLDRRSTPIRPILEEALSSFEPTAAQGGTTLHLDAPEGLTAVADAKRLSQVVFNLVSNSLKFTPSGGRVEVTAARIEQGLCVRVRDTGAGMTQGQIDRLFQPFSQVHDPMQHTKPGTGLGLYICKSLIEEHGGRIWCESDGPGQGTTFTFQIPLEPPNAMIEPLDGAPEGER